MYMGTEIAGSTHVEASVSARLDRLPPTRYFRGLVARIAVGGWFEFYEMFMAAYISLGLIHSGLYCATTAGLFDVNGFASFLGSFFAGMFVGTVALGGVTDRFGRLIVFTFAMLTYSVASFIAAFQHSPPRDARGRYPAFSILVILTSVPVVAVISYALVPRTFLGMEGWRWVMIIGAAGAVFIWFIRHGLPESPRWLESKGRVSEARQIVDEIERKVVAETGKPLAEPPEGPAASQLEARGAWIEMWQGRYFKRTVMLSLFNFCQTFGVYGFGAWVPVLLYSKSITITHCCSTPW
ncbi:MFS transporter [Paraburkholderia sp. CNPSo 3076]|uniref:MFS transporter n=1 Tax=Paraburkholderia sp. CNPSo 3076 TaxID=2940936 RepID=UPI00225A9FD3|nr:MFS transporter [Paraburkholderia sp. CNPSo 3076]MCX5542449.1 MFS transporter [Paraburkholderia sp. CNPSo 3076]